MLDKPFDEWDTYPNHVGIDFPYRAGRTVRASASGRVRWQGWGSGTGNAFTTGAKAGNAKIVVYDNGIEARYCHLLNLNGKQAGERVEYGDIIGYVGSTGYSTGPHLHMEIWINGNIQTNQDFWRYVNRNSYIGDGYGNYERPAGGGGTPLPPPPPPRRREKDEETMLNLVIKTGKSGDHLALLGPGIFSHIVQDDKPNILQDITDAKRVFEVDLPYLGRLLRLWGCDRDIWDIRDGKFVVLDPLSGSIAQGNSWTADKAVRGAVKGITLPAIDTKPLVAAVADALKNGRDYDANEIAKAVRSEFAKTPLK